jgi:hypothetical protein
VIPAAHAVVAPDEAVDREQRGVRMRVRTGEGDPAGTACLEAEPGHAAEFCRETSAFIYPIVEGEGICIPGCPGRGAVVPPKGSVCFRGGTFVRCPSRFPRGREGHIRDIGCAWSAYSLR